MANPTIQILIVENYNDEREIRIVNQRGEVTDVTMPDDSPVYQGLLDGIDAVWELGRGG